MRSAGSAVDVDLETHSQCGRRIDGRKHLVHPQYIGPELLVAERVETEYRLSVRRAGGLTRIRT